jgi:hypothetical protein
MSDMCHKCKILPLKSKTLCEVCLEKTRQYNNNKRLERLNNNLCPTCGKHPPQKGKKLCDSCLESQKKKYQRYRELGLCSRCVKNEASCGKLCQTCLDKCKEERDEYKRMAYVAYGDKCTCCGEKEHVFLSIDHINNDGAEKRRNKEHPRGGADLCRWLINHKFPPEFQLLCHNCQWGKRVFGVCPHQTK